MGPVRVVNLHATAGKRFGRAMQALIDTAQALLRQIKA
jgi:predicted phage tail protein